MPSHTPRTAVTGTAASDIKTAAHKSQRAKPKLDEATAAESRAFESSHRLADTVPTTHGVRSRVIRRWLGPHDLAAASAVCETPCRHHVFALVMSRVRQAHCTQDEMLLETVNVGEHTRTVRG